MFVKQYIAMENNKPSITVAVEWDNAGDVSDQRSKQSLYSLAERLDEARDMVSLPIRVMLIFDRDEANQNDVQQLLNETLGQSPDLIQAELHPVQDMHYYELKNYAAQITTTDILVLYDSDLDADEGFVPKLLQPLEDPNVQVVNGIAHMELSDFTSRAFALFWIFPTEYDDEKVRLAKRFNCNSAAIRTDLLKEIPLPSHPHYRVQCTFWSDKLEKKGIDILKVEATAEHPPPRGFFHILERAALQGRDNDTRYAVRKNPNRLRRFFSAFGRFLKMSKKATLRGLKYGRKFGLQVYQIPFAILFGIYYNFIVFASQAYHSLFGPVITPDFSNTKVVSSQAD